MSYKKIRSYTCALTDLYLASHKRDIRKQNAASDQGLHYLHLVKKFLQNMMIIKKLTLYIGNGFAQRFAVEESSV